MPFGKVFFPPRPQARLYKIAKNTTLIARALHNFGIRTPDMTIDRQLPPKANPSGATPLQPAEHSLSSPHLRRHDDCTIKPRL